MEWACKKGCYQMSRLNECIDYFTNPGFNRFIKAWIKKYQSLGHLGGKIVLENLSLEEKEMLGSFLGLDLSLGKLSISYNKFNQLFQETKFEGIDFLEVIKAISFKPIYTNQQKRAYKETKITNFKNELIQKYRNTYCFTWLTSYLNENNQVNRYINYDQEYFQTVINNVCKALNNLPKHHDQYVLLPVFAWQITDDPHYFDKDLPKELLLKGIIKIFNLVDNDRSLQAVNDIFYHAGLLRDDLSNNCYICHLRPKSLVSNWDGFYYDYEPWNMNLYNLMQVNDKFVKSAVYIVENPAVFRILADFIKLKQLNIGLVCSNGQLNLCTHTLIEKLFQSDCNLYYAGDFDPEGLMIADKLKQKYPSLNLWLYTPKHFDLIKIKQIQISSKRLKILDNLVDQDLRKLASLIKETSCFGYQEGLIDLYLNNIKNN